MTVVAVDSVGVVAIGFGVDTVVVVVDLSAAVAIEASVVVVVVDTVVAVDTKFVVVAQVAAAGYEQSSRWTYREIPLWFLASLVDAEIVVTLVY